MKKLPLLLLFLGLFGVTVSCFEDRDDVFVPASDLEINNFIYQAMNIWYLYKPEVPDLAVDRFETQAELNTYLEGFNTPEDLFYDGLVADIDRFSFITDDYRELERQFQGISLSNGLKFSLARISGSQDVFGFVRYVVPDSPAELAGMERGDLFLTVDGEQLFSSSSGNNFELFDQATYTLGLAEINNGSLSLTGEQVTLNKQENLQENPILINRTLEVNGQKVGYLMYNRFASSYDQQLNAVFGQFKADGITDLVLDLRYNGGGSVRTAIDLSSMITGQFAGQVITQQQWNPQLQEIFENNDPEGLIDRFNTQISTGEAINSLNLSKLYVITTGSTASASELVMIGLDPYIEVKSIGTTTVGKFQASTTFYDSEAPNFGRTNVNTDHFYAIQPLIYTYENSAGVVGPPTGITPDFELQEDIENLGVLGDPDEPLLSAALSLVVANRSFKLDRRPTPFKLVGESEMFNPTFQRMYDYPDLKL